MAFSYKMYCLVIGLMMTFLRSNQVSTEKVPSALENFEEAIGRSTKCANKLLADIAHKASAQEVKQDLTNYEKSLESVWHTFVKLWLTDEAFEKYEIVTESVRRLDKQRIELIKSLKNSDVSYGKTLGVTIDEVGKTLYLVAKHTTDFWFSEKIRNLLQPVEESIKELHDNIYDSVLQKYKEIIEQYNLKA